MIYFCFQELDIERQKFNELQGNQSKIVEATRNEVRFWQTLFQPCKIFQNP